jgi:hypothetical protein
MCNLKFCACMSSACVYLQSTDRVYSFMVVECILITYLYVTTAQGLKMDC